MVVYGVTKIVTRFRLDEESAKKAQDFTVINKVDFCTAVEILHGEGEINLFNGNEELDPEWEVKILEVEM